jgi:hypothetical protein
VSNLIDRLYSFNSKNVKSQKLKNGPQKIYNTLYFENLVDFRLCPKNASRTVRGFYCQLMFNEDKNLSSSERENEYLKNIKYIRSNDPFLFRKSSYKICVKRDPVERALSATKYILKNRLNIIDPTIDDVEEVLDNISIDLDFFFHSQTFWMGSYENYDDVYDIQELDLLVKWLVNDYNYYGVKIEKKNVSKSNIRSEDLSFNILTKVKKFYEIDYDNGWY